MAQKSLRKIYNAEIVWYSILGTVWLIGFVLAILGVCAYNIGKLANNAIYNFQTQVGKLFSVTVVDFRLVGTIAMVAAMLGFLIVIYYFSSKETAESAAKRRYEERMRILMEGDEPAASSEEGK